MKNDPGAHMSFPFRVGADGRTARPPSLEAHVRDELVQLLLTDPGERVFVPAFGGGVRRMVFEPLDEATRGLTRARITQAIATYLDHRVTLEDLTVEVRDSTLEVGIRYRIAGTEDSRQLTFQHRTEVP